MQIFLIFIYVRQQQHFFTVFKNLSLKKMHKMHVNKFNIVIIKYIFINIFKIIYIYIPFIFSFHLM